MCPVFDICPFSSLCHGQSDEKWDDELIEKLILVSLHAAEKLWDFTSVM